MTDGATVAIILLGQFISRSTGLIGSDDSFNFFFREFMFLLLLDSFYDRIRVIRQICDSWINWLFYRGRIGLIDIIQNYRIIVRVNF